MDTTHRVTIALLGLGCAGEAAPLERRLARVAGVRQAYVNPVTDTIYAEVNGDEAEDRLRSIVESSGFRPASGVVTRRGRVGASAAVTVHQG